MLELIIKTFWFLLPAAVANMSPVIFKWVPFLNYPVDFNYSFKGKPLFGKHKTYRGFLFGVLMAILVVYLQRHFYLSTISISVIDYRQVNLVLLGFLFGFGALFGDMIESFFKRQIGIKSGKSWAPFDQTDWIIGSILMVNLYINISWSIIILSVIIFGLLHPLVNVIGYLLKIKKTLF